MQFETQILHEIPVDELTGAISLPIYQTSTFVQEAPGVNRGYDYARTGNPTRRALEDLVAKLECGHRGFAFGSGLAAIDAVLKLLSAGDEIVAVDNVYGGTFRLLTRIFKRFGIKVKFADTTDPRNLWAAISENTKMIWLESPTNPLLKISDIKKISALAKGVNALLVVDNTFASPVIQQPITLGADIVIHSATKYLSGHCDVLAGIVVTANEALSEEIHFIQNSSGGVLGPFDSWLTIRGIQTLSLRVEKQCSNAFRIAKYLQHVEGIDTVYYPGLASHPNHEVAKRQQKYFGAVISFTLKEDTEAAARKFVSSTKLFQLAESLGGVKSLLCHPASMTHGSVPKEDREKAGISDSLVRLSVGTEHAADLISDLDGAFKALEISRQPVKFQEVAV